MDQHLDDIRNMMYRALTKSQQSLEFPVFFSL